MSESLYNIRLTTPDDIIIEKAQQAPIKLRPTDRRVYMDIVEEYINQSMPHATHRIWGQLVATMGTVLACRAVQLLSLAVPGANMTKVPLLSKGAVTGYAMVSGARVGSTVIGRAITKFGERLAKTATGKAALEAVTKNGVKKIIIWSALGFGVDLMEDDEAAEMIDVWSRKIQPENQFLQLAPQYCRDFSRFVNLLHDPTVWDTGDGAFRDYIENAPAKVDYRFDLTELVFAYLWLDAANRWLQNDDAGKKGSGNNWVYSLQFYMAELIITMIAAELEEFTVMPTLPLLGWWDGVPTPVADFLNDVIRKGTAMRKVYKKLGFDDSETIESLGAQMIAIGTKAGGAALTTVTGGGLLTRVAKFAVGHGAKSLSPVVIKTLDLLQ